MAKSAKAKKEKVADFSKAKLKLGKGKKPAANATDTSFKARSIALPNQSITAKADATEPTTKRNLTLDELMVHVKHYSSGVRKDGLSGMRELFALHPEIVAPRLTALISCTVKIVGDEDAGVRKLLMQLYGQIFPLVPQTALLPHAGQILLHVTSALSHIYAEIRVDSISFLNLLMEHAPQIFQKNQQRVLDGYLSLLKLKGKVGDAATLSQASSSSTLSVSAKTIIFKSLIGFLRVISPDDSASSTEHGTQQVPTWFFRTSFATLDAYEGFVRQLRSRPSGYSVQWLVIVEDEDENVTSWVQHQTAATWNLADLLSSDDDTETDIQFGPLIELARVIHPLLISTFLDVAPDVFIPDSRSETQTKLLCAVGELASLIYGSVLRSDSVPEEPKRVAQEGLRAVLGKMSTYFPFGSQVEVKRDVKAEQRLHELNLAYCELTSLLVLTGGVDTKGKGKEGARDPLDVEMERVGEWVVQVMEGQWRSAAHPMGQSLSASAYAALLPTVWSLLSSKNGSLREQVWAATVAHSNRTSTASAVKKLAVEFVGRLILLRSERQYRGPFRTNASETEEWLLRLPRVLWEVDVKDRKCSEIILRLLLLGLHRACLSQEGIDRLGKELIPYFEVELKQQGTKVFGPWRRLEPAGLRKLALDVMSTAMRLTGEMTRQAGSRAVAGAVGGGG